MNSTAQQQALKAAFLLGFMVTREGFNDECPFEHCSEGFASFDRHVSIQQRLRELADTSTEAGALLEDYAMQAIDHIETMAGDIKEPGERPPQDA